MSVCCVPRALLRARDAPSRSLARSIAAAALLRLCSLSLSLCRQGIPSPLNAQKITHNTTQLLNDVPSLLFCLLPLCFANMIRGLGDASLVPRSCFFLFYQHSNTHAQNTHTHRFAEYCAKRVDQKMHLFLLLCSLSLSPRAHTIKRDRNCTRTHSRSISFSRSLSRTLCYIFFPSFHFFRRLAETVAKCKRHTLLCAQQHSGKIGGQPASQRAKRGSLSDAITTENTDPDGTGRTNAHTHTHIHKRAPVAVLASGTRPVEKPVVFNSLEMGSSVFYGHFLHSQCTHCSFTTTTATLHSPTHLLLGTNTHTHTHKRLRLRSRAQQATDERCL